MFEKVPSDVVKMLLNFLQNKPSTISPDALAFASTCKRHWQLATECEFLLAGTPTLFTGLTALDPNLRDSIYNDMSASFSFDKIAATWQKEPFLATRDYATCLEKIGQKAKKNIFIIFEVRLLAAVLMPQSDSTYIIKPEAMVASVINRVSFISTLVRPIFLSHKTNITFAVKREEVEHPEECDNQDFTPPRLPALTRNPK